jgi:hypothetical protein
MIVLMAMYVMGAFGIGAAGAATGAESAYTMNHDAQIDSDCSTMAETDAPMQKGHASCTITVCCFSEEPEFGAMQPKAQLLRTGYALLGDALLTQSEPERAKRPPKHA